MRGGLPWFRFYHEALDDPKVQRLPPPLFKTWINLLCLANRGDPRGALPCVTDIAFALRIGEEEAAEAVADLVGRGLLEPSGAGFEPHNWNGRQQRSDDVNARVRQHRERRKTDETLHETLPKRPMKQDRNVIEKSREEKKRQEGEGDSPPSPPPAAPDPPKVHPYALLEAVCDELGQDATSLSKPAKERQLAAAKRLAGAGIGEGDVRSMVRWLAPQAWVNGAVDMGLLEKQLPKWEMAGRPNGPPRASPSIVARPGHAIRHGKDIGYTNEELDAMIGRGRQ